MYRKKKKRKKAEEVLEEVEKAEERATEKKDTRTPAEKAYAAVQAKRVSPIPHLFRVDMVVGVCVLSKRKRCWKRLRKPTNRE